MNTNVKIWLKKIVKVVLIFIGSISITGVILFIAYVNDPSKTEITQANYNNVIKILKQCPTQKGLVKGMLKDGKIINREYDNILEMCGAKNQLKEMVEKV